jgi:ribosome maturation factor RimP
MSENALRAKILDALEGMAADHGIDIVDVQISGASKSPVVTVRIDHADEELPTITLDEIAEQSGWIGDAIDAIDPFAGSYSIEVSSPGMDRPLLSEKDFIRFMGSEIEVKLYEAIDGKKLLTGTLTDYNDGEITITSEKGKEIVLPKGKAAKVNLAVIF